MGVAWGVPMSLLDDRPGHPTLFDPLEVAGVEARRDLVDGVAFHPAVARWFERRFPDGPSAPQRDGWPWWPRAAPP